MGVDAGVTRLEPGHAYRDAETVVTLFEARAGGRLRLGNSSRPQFIVLESGTLTAAGQSVSPGQLLVLQPTDAVDAVAGPAGARGFACELETPIVPTPRTEALPRPPMQAFHAEQIIVSADSSFQFGGVFNLGEVVIPPDVTTSQHFLKGANERYLMMGGPATMFLDGLEIPVGSGDVVHIPAGCLQNLRNECIEPLRFYCLCTPPFTSQMYRAGPVAGGGPPGFDLARWWQENASRFPLTTEL